jgi:hypothetical protein
VAAITTIIAVRMTSVIGFDLLSTSALRKVCSFVGSKFFDYISSSYVAGAKHENEGMRGLV